LGARATPSLIDGDLFSRESMLAENNDFENENGNKGIEKWYLNLEI